MIELLQGDCLEIMPTLEAQSFDAIIADIPYGTTACSWDTVIPFAPMWENLKRLAKPRAAIVLFGSQPFTSALIMSNPKMFRYEWAWDKCKAGNFALGNIQPLKIHEDICVFYSQKSVYNPQKKQLYKTDKRYLGKKSINKHSAIGISGKIKYSANYEPDKKLPISIIRISKDNYGKNIFHPTQKPVALMEYLIRTYTNEGDTVLDFTMGSGSTLVAAVNTNRNGVGIELREDYYNIAQRRVQEAQAQIKMELA